MPNLVPDDDVESQLQSHLHSSDTPQPDQIQLYVILDMVDLVHATDNDMFQRLSENAVIPKKHTTGLAGFDLTSISPLQSYQLVVELFSLPSFGCTASLIIMVESHCKVDCPTNKELELALE